VKHPGRWIALAAGAVVVVLGVILALNVGNDPQLESQKNRIVGKAVPAFDLPTLTGEHVKAADLAGKTVVVNFWNTWCIPCQDELPALKQFYDAHAGDADFAMVGIVRDAQKSNDAIARYVQQKGMNWTIALDPGSEAALDFGTRGQPETFVISPGGQVVGFQYAQVTVSDLEQMLSFARAES
jgi:cytochrome c biogenesis protein CcmG/thiol:disulfide interchange protein DsbE